MPTITPKQKQVLDFTSAFIKNEGFAPSINEIKNNLGLKSVATIHQHLQALEKKGYIKREKNQKRHLEIVAEIPLVIKPEKIADQTKKYDALPLNQIICGDAVEELKKIPDNSIDLVVTSPPYDEIRKYNGFSFDLHKTGMELFRILKNGGVAAMVIQDQTKSFAKTLTSFRTIVDWVDNIGFRLFENVIYRKYGTEGAWWKHRFRVDHEYMPIFIKGERPQYFNKEPLKVPSKHGGKVMTGSGNRRTDGKTTKTVTRIINQMKCRGTIWDYLNAGDKNPLKRKHPAVFPDKIPFDFIQCFCPPNGIVLDPFIGSGSTSVSAKKLNRNFIGIDLSKEYCDLAQKRLGETLITLL
ncbi:MAG: DNA methyltransferase [Minisyncoccia bacterium]